MQCCEKINCFEKGHICVPETKLPRIIIVGGGFAGLNLVKKLRNMPVQVVLIDKNNFHQFMPLLYQVATSGIEPDSIVFPFRKLFNNFKNVVFRMAEVTGIDSENKRLNTSIGYVYYDYLVLAGGSTTNYFGNDGFKNFGQGLKSVTDSLDIRSELLQNLEKAAVTCIKEEKEILSSIAIIGGGPAGVEMAGALAEFKKYVLPRDYPELKNIEMKIFLIEANNRLLQQMPTKLSDKTINYLSEMKVDVLLNTRTKMYDGTKITLDNGNTINAATFIWTAGVQGVTFSGLPTDAINKQNRIIVDSNSKVKSLANVFAIGDLAVMKTKEYPNGHPMVAQAAIQQGKTLATNLIKIIKDKPASSFKYHDKGSMATIGKKKAVAVINNMKFSGFLAWLIWSFIHLMTIIGVRNKLLIAINWLWNYFSYDKGDRVIIRKYSPVPEKIQVEY
ncbi:MAG: NAD(P)/FAD-dependent oxidoreductase [Chlorobi bacterium]|nr:NAD(P)/FAD-dependent oxidoreductase [Chlorobiota bacterium]